MKLALLISIAAPLLSNSMAVGQAILPFIGTDQIAVRDNGKDLLLAGSIENIEGEILTFRERNSQKIGVHRLNDLGGIAFSRPPAWDLGQGKFEAKEYRRAFEYFDKAIRSESRIWARTELQGAVAALSVQVGRFDEAVELIEDCFEADKRIRHVSLLPLVWARELDRAEKVEFRPADLSSQSLIRIFIAASAGLEYKEHRTTCAALLQEIRKCGIVRLAQLAEAQLWRIDLFESVEPVQGLIYRSDAVNYLPPEARGGPALVLGRLLAKAHRYDEAAISLLWLPTTHPHDHGLAAFALSESARMCEQSGRPSAAQRLRSELVNKFPNTSAAKKLLSRSIEPAD